MNKILLSLLLSATAVGAANAVQLSPSEALARVNSMPASERKLAPGAPMQLVYTATENGINDFYVFNRHDKGFMIVSADDRITPVLGYSDKGTFDPQNIPDNMREWLLGYQAQITWAIENGVNKQYAPSRSRSNIAPLATAMWDQGAPYNNLCPQQSGQRTYTGCVATAMAEVMYANKWPEKGVGSHSYKWEGQNLSVNFANTTYDWANMLPEYTSTSTDAQKKAVATLMYSCGVSVEMNYGVDASGAPGVACQEALIKYFNYDKGCQYLLREYFRYTEWEDLIYKDLSEGHPVLYDGRSEENEGHEFVCDGYENGYFHINWGWSGMANGYFLLTALDPESQGAGGSTSGFNFNQGVTIGIKKPVAGSTTPPFMVTLNAFEADDKVYTTMTPMEFSGTFVNYSRIKANVTLGIKMVDASGKAHYIESGASDNNGVGITDDWMLSGWEIFKIDQADVFALGTGTYTLTPAFYDKNAKKWGDIRVPISENQGYTATVTKSMISLTPLAQKAKLSMNDMTLETPLYANSQFMVKGTLTSENEEYYGIIRAVILKKGSSQVLVEAENPMQVDVLPGAPQAVEYVSTFVTSYTGDYEMAMMDGNDNIISNRINVNLQASVGGETEVEFSKVSYAGGGMMVPVNDARFTGTVTCTSGFFSGNVEVYIFDWKSGNAIAKVSSPVVSVKQGETATYTTSGSIASVGVGKRCSAAVVYNNKIVSDSYIFRTAEATTGIDDINDDSGIRIANNVVTDVLTIESVNPVESVEIFNLAGQCVAQGNSETVDVTSLTAGMYIVKIKAGDSLTTKRIIKK